MSTIETMPESAVRIVRREDKDNEELPITYYSLMVGDEEVAELNKYDGEWQVVIGEAIYGNGATLVDAITDAFTTGLNDMKKTIDYAKAIAVEHGAELMRLAEACK